MSLPVAISINTQNVVHFETPRQQRGWRYLLADSVSFQKQDMRQHSHSIRMQKPQSDQLPTWIKRLITSGQCEAIYVENLQLADEEALIIKALCTEYCVSLVGLTVATQSVNDACNANVIQGPWSANDAQRSFTFAEAE
ncbi:hypothetical protein [Alteromonas oceanisediminis]|uniref:hypothetical protein n=1 Tax=Alteromonas oceanisediminis TaxID=2836180 RepID=UPI001BD9A517|nr:hypothetical protein [Alteromonas oceanisediminis]MBT0586426.1 hypothetical protein [Alteromonas oceanisediminis]